MGLSRSPSLRETSKYDLGFPNAARNGRVPLSRLVIKLSAGVIDTPQRHGTAGIAVAENLSHLRRRASASPCDLPGNQRAIATKNGAVGASGVGI